MPRSFRSIVGDRAEHRCEYCRLPEDKRFTPTFHLDHIIPRKHGGTNELDNLALACHRCNLYKGPNLSGIDPATGELTPLFNPRANTWAQHFIVHQISISGRSSIGRTTVTVLRMNALRRLRLRSTMLKNQLIWP